jgi:hypothetical protein
MQNPLMLLDRCILISWFQNKREISVSAVYECNGLYLKFIVAALEIGGYQDAVYLEI